MPPTFSRLLEKVLVLVLALSFALPLILGGVSVLPGRYGRFASSLGNRPLGGHQSSTKPVTFSVPHVLSAKYQKNFAKNFDASYQGRELIIRLFNELSLRVFRTTAVGVLVGPRYSLIQRNYAEEYCLNRPRPEVLVPLVTDLRRLQDFCDARGIAFAFVITPSKAALYPEGLPPDWLRRVRPEPRAYDQLIPLLQAKGVRYVDGHRLTAALKPIAQAPVFPLGGVHWSKEAAVATANGLLELLAAEKLGVQPIRHYDIQTSDLPTGQDADLANLCNLLWPMRYPVAAVTIPPVASPNARQPNVVFVGGSFVYTLLEVLDASQQFSEFRYYFYYRDSKGCYNDGEMHAAADPAPPPDFETDVFAADALVLEGNEQTICEGVQHLQRFLHDALAVLPDPHALKAPFHRETWLNYRWGDTLSFVAGKGPIDPAVASGLGQPTSTGTYTVGPVATLRLSAPPPTGDVALEVEAGAFLVDTRLPEQRVGVEVNGHRLAEWTWQANTPPHHELVIPAVLLNRGEFRLRFRITRPGSPAEFGLSRDVSPYGIALHSVRLYPVGAN